MIDPVLAALLLLIVLAAINIVLLMRRPAEPARMVHLLEQSIAQARADAETTRGLLATSERALAGSLAALSTTMVRDGGDARVLLETKLREMSDQAALRLGAIQHAVNETLATTVEKQMTHSFQRVIDQFGQVQKAMGDVQAVTAQIGDLKRIFSNVKQRGTWGETHLRALLEDMFPQGGWESNRKLREGSDEMVEFAVIMPVRRSPSARSWRWMPSSRSRITTACCWRQRPAMPRASASPDADWKRGYAPKRARSARNTSSPPSRSISR